LPLDIPSGRGRPARPTGGLAGSAGRRRGPPRCEPDRAARDAASHDPL